MDENNSLNIENGGSVDQPENAEATQAFTWTPTNSDAPADGTAQQADDIQNTENSENTSAAEPASDSTEAEQEPAAEDAADAPEAFEDEAFEECAEDGFEPHVTDGLGEEEPMDFHDEIELTCSDTDVEINMEYDENATNDPTPPRTPPKHKGFKTTLIVMAIIFAVALTLMTISLTVGIFQNVGDATSGNTPIINMEITDKGPTTVEDGLASAELLEDVHNSVVIITNEQENGTGFGSGFIVSEDGYIVTNEHVIEGYISLTVQLYDGKTYEAEVVGSSPLADIAVLKINAKNLNNIVIGKSENCYIGERVYAIGCPDGYELAWTTTMGIISHTNRKIKIYDDEGALEKTMTLLQTDAAVNHGNSGGPLINTRGEVVGIVTLKMSNTAGLGFAIPIDTAMQVVQEIMTTGSADESESLVSAPRAMLGITCVSVSADKYYVRTESGIKAIDKEQADALGVGNYIYSPVGGIYVISTDSRYNAVGKLFEGDIITELNGSAVKSNSQLSYLLDDCVAGDTITLKVYRNGEYIDVNIVLAQEVK